MKRRARLHGSGSPHSTGLLQLEGLPLRLIALKLSDPGPLALSCTAAHRSITSGGDFDDEWFLRWVHALVPLRPWQYAAVGWRRLGGQHTTAEQLCAFILRISAVKHTLQQEQDVLHAQHAIKAPSAAELLAATLRSPEQPNTPAQQGQPDPAHQQQQQPNPEQEDAPDPADSTPKPALMRARFSPMPHLAPLPSVVRQARKLLAKGDADVRALAVLCPGYAWVLYQYAAAAGNAQLLAQLITGISHGRFGPFPTLIGPYPSNGMSVSRGGVRIVSVAQAAACAAMRAGHTSVLAMLLLNAGASIRSRPYQLVQLFRFAVRHSNAACIQQLLAFAPCTDCSGFTKLTPWPQHLAMAAGRVDPWAGEVVSLLLRVMNRKLLATKYMGPVYGAACRTGHIPVLQQFVQQLVERSPAAHWPVLLRAAAVAGNRSIWQQLLGQREDQQQLQEPPAGSGVAAAAAIPLQAPSAGLSSGGSGLLSYFSRWFAPQPTQRQHQQQPQPHQQQQEVTSGRIQQGQPQHDSTAQQQHKQQEIWQLLQLPLHSLSVDSCWPVLSAMLDGCCPSVLRAVGQEGLRLTADADRLAMADALWQLLGKQGWQDTVRAAAQQQLCADVAPWASYGGVQQLLEKSPPHKLVWMLQHDMLPQLPNGWLVAPAAAEGLKSSIRLCLKYRQRHAAAALWQLAKRLQVQVPVRALVQGCLDGAVHKAAAAHRIEDLQQQAVLFAQYHASLCGNAVSPGPYWIVLRAAEPLHRLLTVLSCVWNTAAVVHARGLPQQLGIPWQQHLRLCAAAVLPPLLQALLPHVPTSIVVKLFEVPIAPGLAVSDSLVRMTQMVVVQLQPLLQQYADEGLGAVAAAGLDSIPDSRCQDSESWLLKCMWQLWWLCQLREDGVRGLVFPINGELNLLPTGSPSAAAMLGVGKKQEYDQFVEGFLSDARQIPVPGELMDCLVEATAALRAKSEHGQSAADIKPSPSALLGGAAAVLAEGPGTAATTQSTRLLSAAATAPAPPAAAAAGGSGLAGQQPAEQAAAAALPAAVSEGLVVYSGIARVDMEGLMYTLHNVQAFCKKQFPVSAAAPGTQAATAAAAAAATAAAAQQPTDTSSPVPMDTTPATPAAATATDGRTPAAPGSTRTAVTACSSSGGGCVNIVPPLWQLAALALPVSEFTTVERPLAANSNIALEAALSPILEGSHTPAFLAGCCSSQACAGTTGSSSSSGGTGSSTSAAVGLAAGPKAPPEHGLVGFVLKNAVWLHSQACTWSGCLHRMDAAAWALHPRQGHLWAYPINRKMLGMYVNCSMEGLGSHYSSHDPLLVRAHEQQLRQHQQALAAGVTWGGVSSSGGGVLPRFVAGGADAATALLADREPVPISKLVQRLGGGSSSAHIEYVKGALAAVLATPAEQIKAAAVEAPGDRHWIQVTVGAIRKASEVGDMDLMALLVLLDVQAWCIRPSDFWLDAVP